MVQLKIAQKWVILLEIALAKKIVKLLQEERPDAIVMQPVIGVMTAATIPLLLVLNKISMVSD